MKKTKEKMRRKWIKAIWNDIRRFFSESWYPIFLVIGICVLGYESKSKILEKQEKIEELEYYNNLLQEEQLELLETKILLEEQIDDLVLENQIFSSMFAEIENEPGGHEILDKLYNEKR